MTINVFEQIRPFLVFDSEDDFYHLQVMKRKKENPELGSNSYVIKTYYITSVKYLEDKLPEIINLCEFNNARACLNLNRRSFEKIAFQTLRKVSEQIFNKDFKSVRKCYESVCGAYSNEPNKKWIIDIDTKDEVVFSEVIAFIEFKITEPLGNKVYVALPTKAGYHIITKPFRLDLFMKEFPDLDVHKDNPVNLLIP